MQFFSLGFNIQTAVAKAIKDLNPSLTPKVKVLKEGETQIINTIDIESGVGDNIIIPSKNSDDYDCKIFSDNNIKPLQIDQPALTSDSFLNKKFLWKTNVLDSGSTVKEGKTLALVYSTEHGTDTFFGNPATLIDETESSNSSQMVMTTISAMCLVTVLVWIVIEYGVQLLGRSQSCAFLSKIIVIIVGGIPVAMPTISSFILAIGTYDLAIHGALVKRFTVIEKLAGMDMLYSGKFGALSLKELIETADGFAHTFPEHKYEIVKSPQGMGNIGGMTGDGVTDSPALEKSNAIDMTDATRAAADIVLTEPGLGVIVEAVIGARKTFQSMKGYAKYTVAMSFRNCFTFGLLTVIYDWNFSTHLIILLTLWNYGTIITLSRDRDKVNPNPDTWFLNEIFVFGLVYGLYLTLSSWALFYVASHTDFGEQLNLSYDLQYPQAGSYCAAKLLNQTEMSQCVADIVWERQSRLQSLMYCQVSISGMALIFVTRTRNGSFLSRPALPLVVAFVTSQCFSTFFAAWLKGDPAPVGSVACQFCEEVSDQGPDSTSILGCGTWVIVAWIWSIVWFILLDPIKFVLTAIFERKLTD
eukprot:Pgem_evm1s17995